MILRPTARRACGERQFSYESTALQGGYFTYYMIDRAILQRLGDVNDDKVVSIEEAFAYAKANIGLKKQKPEMDNQYLGDMIL